MSPGDDTATSFLDAAERLFSERGFEGTKVRAIAEAAGVNLGALHYYWGSKEALFRAVCERRLRPVIEERRKLLEACVAAAPQGRPSVEALLSASVSPVLRHLRADEGPAVTFGALMARSLTDPAPEAKTIIMEVVGAGTERYVKLLRQACSHLDDEAFFWRLHGVFGMVQHLYAPPSQHTEFTRKRSLGRDFDRGLAEVVAFLKAGLAAEPALPAPAVADRARPARAARRTLAASR